MVVFDSSIKVKNLKGKILTFEEYPKDLDKVGSLTGVRHIPRWLQLRGILIIQKDQLQSSTRQQFTCSFSDTCIQKTSSRSLCRTGNRDLERRVISV